MTIAPAELAPTPEISSDRLTYHPLRGTVIDKIVAHADGIPLADGSEHNPPWAEDFPQEGDVDAARILQQAGLVLDGGGDFGARVITEKSSGEVIGTIGFFGPQIEGEVEVGYGIVPSRQRRGYATEAVAAAVLFAFSKPDVDRVRASTLPDNTASQKVLLDNGFVPSDQSGPESVFVLARPIGLTPAR